MAFSSGLSEGIAMAVARVDNVLPQEGHSKQLAHLQLKKSRANLVFHTLMLCIIAIFALYCHVFPCIQLSFSELYLFFFNLASADGMFSKQFGQK